jgi:prepilin signal peptidase PulO-like enzyme (type II secretory pathway)
VRGGVVVWVGLAIVAGTLVGVLIRWRVRRLDHRRPEEASTSIPTIWTALGVGATLWITGPLAGVGAILAAALCGGAVLYALVAGCVLAIAWAIARRRSELAFGPWLALGAVLAVGLAR